MNCPICGKEMAKGTVISSGSMPFNTNITFKFELHTENVRSILLDTGKEGCCILLSGLWPCDCLLQDEVNFAAFILQDKPGRFSGGISYKPNAEELERARTFKNTDFSDCPKMPRA